MEKDLRKLAIQLTIFAFVGKYLHRKGKQNLGPLARRTLKPDLPVLGFDESPAYGETQSDPCISILIDHTDPVAEYLFLDLPGDTDSGVLHPHHGYTPVFGTGGDADRPPGRQDLHCVI